MDNPQIYLASRSPRRSTLIEQLGIRYKILDVAVDEQPREGEKPADYVKRLAVEKALCGWGKLSDGKIPVLGADTCIVINDKIIGKVDSREQSTSLMKQMSGSSHEVLTGIALVGSEGVGRERVGQEIEGNKSPVRQEVRINASKITFRSLSEEECEHYWDTGEPEGKAGGYAIQGLAAAFIKKIEGSYSGVMGLPLCELTELMSEFGIQWYDKDNSLKE